MPVASALQGVALVYLVTAPAAKRTAAALRKELSSLVEDADQVSNAIDSLTQRGWIVSEGRSRLATTPAGAAEAAHFLGLAQVPSRLRWASARKMLLFRSVGITGTAVKGTPAEILVGTAAASAQGIPAPNGLTAARARDLLVCRQLGMDPSRPLTLEAIRRHLLAPLAGDETHDSATMVKHIAARSVGARSLTATELQRAAFRKWLATPSQDLGTFARDVVIAARHATTGRFGDDKVFIAHVWRGVGGDVAQFKQRLIEANRERLLTLARADLVSVMDPQDVAESETKDGFAEFHFVVVPAA